MLRRRVDRSCLIAWLLSLPVCAVGWWATGDPGTLIGVLGIPVLWVVLHFLLPVRQIIERSPPTSPALRMRLGLLMGWGVLGIATILAIGSLGDDIGLLPILGMLFLSMLVCVTGMVSLGNLMERERRRLYAPIERAAVAEWEAAEAMAGRDWAIGEEGER
jgi:hypothetical protein